MQFKAGHVLVVEEHILSATNLRFIHHQHAWLRAGCMHCWLHCWPW